MLVQGKYITELSICDLQLPSILQVLLQLLSLLLRNTEQKDEKEASSRMYSCWRTVPSKYLSYVPAQTKSSKNVSSLLFAYWSHNEDKSCL